MKYVNGTSLVDFASCPRILRTLGGSDRKFEVEYNGAPYILKFAENHAKKSDMSTSYVNNVLAEYISSHIIETTGLPVHETLLGTYNGTELVVACKDFRKAGEYNIEFSEFLRSVYDSKDIGKIVHLGQLYETINASDVIPLEIKKASIERFWDTFVVDAITGNFDRHAGNWGYISDGKSIEISPIYDNGSTLLPQLSDEGMDKMSENGYEMLKRCLVFPAPVLCVTKEKVGKVGYYDMLSSGYDENCTKSLLKMYSKLNMNSIYAVIDATPEISNNRKAFYKLYITYRKETIIDRAYECCRNGFDHEAFDRIANGKSYTEALLKEKLAKGAIEPPSLSSLDDYCKAVMPEATKTEVR